jgi:hypothetical protein
MVGTQFVVPAQATGTITVTDYAKLHLTSATGAITYGTPNVLTKASTTITVSDYANISGTATITINGAVLTNGVEWSNATGDNETAESIAHAIVTAAATTLCGSTTHSSAVVSVIATTGGTAANGRTVATSDAVRLTPLAAVLSGGLAASTVTVNGTLCTCVASAPGANQFSNIAELEALTEAVSGITSSQDGTTVSLSYTAGAAGNAIAMSKTGAGLALSGALLTGGYNASTITINGDLFTESAEYTAETSNDVTAQNIDTAVTAATGIDTTCTGNVVTIKANLLGSTGNAIPVLSSDAVRLALSGPTLTGGSSGIIGTSGSPEAIFALNVLASTSACTANLYNGTTNADTLVMTVDCAKNARTITKFKNGVVFPSGLFIDLTLEDVDAAPTELIVSCEKI